MKRTLAALIATLALGVALGTQVRASDPNLAAVLSDLNKAKAELNLVQANPGGLKTQTIVTIIKAIGLVQQQMNTPAAK